MNGFFPTALAFTLGREVGYSEQAVDPGGATQDGVTQATLDDARATIPGLPLDVKDLTESDEARIYQAKFWSPISGDALPNYLALSLFDAAVNSGPATAVRWLQQSLSVGSDGVVGSLTLAAVGRADPHTLLREFHARRAFNYMKCPPAEIAVDGLGWGRRLMLAHDTAAALVP